MNAINAAAASDRRDGSDAARIRDEGISRAATTISWRARVSSSLALPVFVVILLIVALGSTQTTLFVAQDTWTNILRTSSFVIIVACFEGLVMISGGLDLSVGASFLAGAMMAAHVVDTTGSNVLAVTAGLAVGLSIGLINGVLTNMLMISPIIATLGTMFGVNAIVVTLSGGTAIGPLPESFGHLADIDVGFVPLVFLSAIAIAAGVHVVLEYTGWGVRIRAIGGNREAAQKVGVDARTTSVAVYAMTGMFAALAGIFQAASLGSGSPTYGTGMELNVIAAVVIGGVSIYGAIGTISGIVAGSLLLSLITIGLVLLRISGSMQDFFIGVVLILAVLIDRARRARMFKASLDKVAVDQVGGDIDA